MLIGFNGKIGSGKDTAGERLAELVAWDAERLSFAAPLKESAAALLDIDPTAWEHYKNDPNVRIRLIEDQGGVEELLITDLSAREFLQRYGTESHRDVFGENFWADIAIAKYHPISNVYYYVTDCRFVNEAQTILSNFGVIIEVIGPDEETGEHLSEATLPKEYISFHIDNSVRDDNYASLDNQLMGIAQIIGLPLAQGVF